MPLDKALVVDDVSLAEGALGRSVPRADVALIRPPVIFKDGAVTLEATPALGLAYLSSYLKKHGHATKVIDAMGEALNNVWSPEGYPGFKCQGLNFDEVYEMIPKNTQVIGITAMFSGEWPIVRDMISFISKKFPKALIVAGGEHITAVSEYCLRDCPELDLVVRGEGEHTFYEIVEYHMAGLAGVPDIHGIGYLNGEEYVQTGANPRIRNIDSIPWPDWPEGYLEKYWDAGKSFGPQTARDMPMMFSRGCPYQCAFCSNPQMYTTRYILRDIDDVLAEVETWIKKYNITAVQLYDLTAIMKKSWIIEFFTKVIDRGIKIQWDFPSGTRSEDLDEEVIAILRKAGTQYFCFAPESGSQRTLDRVKKRVNLNKITNSIMTAKSYGMTVRANTIIGFPGEERVDIWKTLLYGLKLVSLGVAEIQPYIFMPYPGSELFAEISKTDERIVLNDEYFLSLNAMNSDITNFSNKTFAKNVGPRELAFYRFLFAICSYGLGYLVRPLRIYRTIKNVFSHDSAATVFEHRLKDFFRRKTKSSA